MAQSGTPAPERPGTAVAVIAAPSAPPSFARVAPRAVFVSQLLAAHHNMPSQRLRRRAPLGQALGAYEKAGEARVRRLPAGSYSNLVV